MAEFNDTKVFGNLNVIGDIYQDGIKLYELYESKDLGGGIEEFNENMYGKYIRYKSGIQFTWNLKSEIRTTRNNSYEEENMRYPAEFLETPTVLPIQRRDGGIQWAGVSKVTQTNTSIYLIAGVGGTSLGQIGFFAFGRWK